MQFNPTKFKSRKEWEEYLWDKFLVCLEKEKSGAKIKKIFNNLISISEQQKIIRRLALFELVKKRYSYSQISEILWVSPNTIRTAIKNLKTQSQYKSSYGYIKGKEEERRRKEVSKKPKSLFEELNELDFSFGFPPLPTKSGRGRWTFLSHLKARGAI